MWSTNKSGAKSVSSGFSLIEVLVIIGILVVILAILVPSVQSSRESVRRVSCVNNLRQIGLASQALISTERSIPREILTGSFLVQLLRFIDQVELAEQTEQATTEELIVGGFRTPELFICPSETRDPLYRDRAWSANYVGNWGTGVLRNGYDGIFGTEIGDVVRPLYPSEITDGTSHTALASECLMSTNTDARGRIYQTPRLAEGFADLMAMIREVAASDAQTIESGGRGTPWTDGDIYVTGYQHAMLPNESSGFNAANVPTGLYSSSGNHFGGVNVAFADGHVRFCADEIDEEIWWAMGSRNGNEAVGGLSR